MIKQKKKKKKKKKKIFFKIQYITPISYNNESEIIVTHIHQ